MRIFLTLFCITILFLANSQDSLIYFDRPGIAEGPYIVAKKTWQIETGCTYVEGASLKEIATPSVMLRKALFGPQELRLCFNTNPQMFAILNDPLRSGVATEMIGIKRKLFKEKGARPEASVLFNTFVPLKNLEKYALKDLATYELGVQFNHYIGKAYSLNYNFGILDNKRFKNGVVSQSTSFCYQNSPKLGFFAEFFTYVPLESLPLETGIDGGILICPIPSCQIDLSYIQNFYNNSSYGSLLLGFSFQIKH